MLKNDQAYFKGNYKIIFKEICFESTDFLKK